MEIGEDFAGNFLVDICRFAVRGKADGFIAFDDGVDVRDVDVIVAIPKTVGILGLTSTMMCSAASSIPADSRW